MEINCCIYRNGKILHIEALCERDCDYFCRYECWRLIRILPPEIVRTILSYIRCKRERFVPYANVVSHVDYYLGNGMQIDRLEISSDMLNGWIYKNHDASNYIDLQFIKLRRLYYANVGIGRPYDRFDLLFYYFREFYCCGLLRNFLLKNRGNEYSQGGRSHLCRGFPNGGVVENVIIKYNKFVFTVRYSECCLEIIIDIFGVNIVTWRDANWDSADLNEQFT